jgi:hypothetical protein
MCVWTHTSVGLVRVSRSPAGLGVERTLRSNLSAQGAVIRRDGPGLAEYYPRGSNPPRRAGAMKGKQPCSERPIEPHPEDRPHRRGTGESDGDGRARQSGQRLLQH